MTLELTTLGESEIRVNGVAQPHQRNERRVLLLAMLAESDKPLRREAVALLLWPYADQALAHTNLRGLLFRMRRNGFGPFLTLENETIRLNPTAPIACDLTELRGIIAGSLDVAAGERALELHHGPFLAGLSLAEYPVLAEWAESIQYELEVQLVRFYLRLIPYLLQQQAHEPALRVATQLIELAPYDDEAQALYVRSLAANGQVARALISFKAFARTMATEFPDWEPSHTLAATIESLTQLGLAARLPTPEQAPSHTDNQPRSAPHGESTIPPASSLVGRERETAWLETLLDRQARLISVVGLGGIGKTAFVRSCLPALHSRFGPRLYAIDLRNYGSRSDEAGLALLHLVAGKLNLQPQADGALFDQVQGALAVGPTCLVLDNFETLHGAALTVAHLLEQTPSLTIILTTRQALSIKDETLMSLGGLRVAEDMVHQDASAETVAWSDAAELFLRRSARTHVPFEPAQLERSDVERLCRQLGGHPLAIELAAAQLDFYGLDELLAVTTRDSSLLSSVEADRSGEHASLRRILAQMRAPLSPAAQEALAQLSIFAGAFHRKAMEVIAPAPMAVYRELRNASLLQGEGDPGWFSLHPLVKQSLVAQLASDEFVHARHARYFLGLLDLGDRMKASPSSAQASFIRTIRTYHAEVIAAWNWAVYAGEWDLLERAIVSFSIYLDSSGLQADGIQLFRTLVDRMPPDKQWTPCQYRLAGHAALFLGLYSARTKADDDVVWREQGIVWLEAAGDTWDLAAANLLHAGSLLSTGRNWRKAVAPLQCAAVLINAHRLDGLRIALDQATSSLHRYSGDWHALRNQLDKIVPLVQHNTKADLITVGLLHSAILGEWAHVQRIISMTEERIGGRTNEARIRLWTEYYASHLLRHKADLSGAVKRRQAILGDFEQQDSFMLPMALGELALWQVELGDPIAARATAAQALGHVYKVTDPLTTGFGLLFAGVVAQHSGDTDAARAHLQDVLAHGQRIRDPLMIFSPLCALAQLYADVLPADLLLRIVKIGAVSPVMHFALRPLVQSYLVEQGIAIEEDERESLWATDAASVDALVADVARYAAIERIKHDTGHPIGVNQPA